MAAVNLNPRTVDVIYNSIQSEVKWSKYEKESGMDNPKVLIVEDDLAFVTLIQLALRDLNFEFEVAKDGRSALEHLTNAPFDLVISDYRLPYIDGLEIIRKALRLSPNCKTVLISASSAESLPPELKDLPLLGFIEKPFSPIQFRDLVTKKF